MINKLLPFVSKVKPIHLVILGVALIAGVVTLLATGTVTPEQFNDFVQGLRE